MSESDSNIPFEVVFREASLVPEATAELSAAGEMDIRLPEEKGFFPIVPVVIACVIGISGIAALIAWVVSKRRCQVILDARTEPIRKEIDCRIRDGRLIILTKDGERVEIVEVPPAIDFTEIAKAAVTGGASLVKRPSREGRCHRRYGGTIRGSLRQAAADATRQVVSEGRENNAPATMSVPATRHGCRHTISQQRLDLATRPSGSKGFHRRRTVPAVCAEFSRLHPRLSALIHERLVIRAARLKSPNAHVERHEDGILVFVNGGLFLLFYDYFGYAFELISRKSASLAVCCA